MKQNSGPADGSFSVELTVPGDAIDRNGHVSNVAFVQWMQDVAYRHFEHIGGVPPMEQVGGTWVVRSHKIDYLSPAYLGQVLRLRTWVDDFGRARSLRRYEFVRVADEKLIARGETDWVFVDVRTGRPCSIPKEIRSIFASLAQGRPRTMDDPAPKEGSPMGGDADGDGLTRPSGG
jgi:acyl-CoA thioester hydrolase